jgi:ketosteroid isomerase-like protein
MADLSRRTLFAAAGIAALVPTALRAEPSLELGAILDKYAAALKAGNVEALVRLYTANGSFMAPNTTAAVGPEALRAAYKRVFTLFAIEAEFNVWEAAKYAEVGWLRSTSKVRTKTLATGKEVTNTFNQLAVFQPEGRVWKIRSYVYTPA